MPNFPQHDSSPPASDFYTSPWTDELTGQQWTSKLVAPEIYRWHPYAAAGGSSVWGSITGTLADQTDLGTALGLKAPLASPTFTGTVTIPSGASISGYLTTATAASTYQPIGSYAPASGIAASAITGTAVTLDGDNLFTGNLSVEGDITTATGFSGQGSGITGIPLTAAVTGILPKANGGTGVSSLGATGESLMQAATTTAAWTGLGGTGTAASPVFGAATISSGSLVSPSLVLGASSGVYETSSQVRIKAGGANAMNVQALSITIASNAVFGITSTSGNAAGGVSAGLSQGTVGQWLFGTGAVGSFAGRFKATNGELVGTLAVTGASTLANTTISGAVPIITLFSTGTSRSALIYGGDDGDICFRTGINTKGFKFQNNTGITNCTITDAGAMTLASTLAVTGNGTMSNFKRGTGSPESVVTGSVGDLYTRTDGGAGTTLYVKESGSATNTGWVAK